MENNRRRFTVVVYYRPRKMYYIALKCKVFSKCISSNVGCVIDAYIGFCTSLNRKMTPFGTNSPVVPSSYDDAMSSN